ncbi:MAG: GAF domain-containing protein [Clostridiales bacterium]|nr:GAF domain-containing protein [Clostridiales bacterium]MCF8021478.1 GAF domain-containing protein [Clostridiales bacterium]
MSERLFDEKLKTIESLTGVNSSKLNYYLEAKQQSEEVIKQNNRLEIIHQINQDINIDMSWEDILKRVYQRFPQAIHYDFLGLALLKRENLYMSALVPGYVCENEQIPGDSELWDAVNKKQIKVYDSRVKSIRLLENLPVKDLYFSSAVIAPLIVKENVIGILLLGSKNERSYDCDEIKFINQLAGQLAMCIENARLYDQVLKDKKEWEETFNAVIDPISLIDLNYNVLRYNKSIEVLRGKENSKTQKTKCYKLLWNRETKCEQCLLDEVYKTSKSVYRRLQLSTGKVFDVFYYPVFNETGEIYAFIHHMKDVTEQVKVEAQLMQSAKLAAIGEMAAGVAHELNSPMTAILGNAQMLLRELEEDDPNTEYVNDIVNCGLRCKKIIQNLLTFSRQEERPVSFVNINDVVERVVGFVKYQINRNNINIIKKLDNELPEIQANGHQLDQVILNLLLNSRDALENNENEKRIIVLTGQCDYMGEKAVFISVRDNGEGIAPECRYKIFNPFYTSKELNEGTGLGLSVSLGIAESHGGNIEVESKLGEGSKFCLLLPVNK